MLTRDNLIEKLKSNIEWDVVVIGGGATGLGTALDAVSRGYNTLLVEGADFAKGTSSRSTKLVHGGVRYLAQGDIRLVREASIERGILYRNAPHLVRNQTFIIPVYGYWDMLIYGIGLKLYDWISGKFSLGSSISISRKETIKRLPGISTEGLVGGVLYHDGQFDDARLAVNLVQTIIDRGGCAVNYTRVTGLLKNGIKRMEGVVVQDMETGSVYEIRAKAVVNATGVFVDEVMALDNPGRTKTISVSQGVHLVLDRKFYPSDDALMIPRTSDGRVLFAVPWHHTVVVGTTDTPVNEASLEPKALDNEIDFILETASAYFSLKPERKDVLSVFAGLRPLAAPQRDHQKTKEISRSHKIIVSPSCLFTILGGKWTTYRKMGEDMINRIEKELQWNSKTSLTTGLHIHGYQQKVNWSEPFYFYGSDASAIQHQSENEGEWISESLKIHAVQVKWAVEKEMARTVEDVLARRTRALFLNAAESIRMAPKVAAIMATLLQKDEYWIEEQVAAYTHLAYQYF